MQHYSEYTLGWRGPSNKKADKGTICHKVLELCALCKLAIQRGEKVVEDNDIGEIFTDQYDPEYLNDIISRVYMFYTTHLTHHTWEDKDFKDCVKWVWKALEYNNGMFDPMNCNVVDAEPHFDFELPFDWAEYDYKVEGKQLKGNLALKGTIDLIVDRGNGVYEICDWKTGKRLDWATGATKDQTKLFSDAQLRIYHYAVTKLYPEAKTFIVTIYFINDGGAFTVHFQDSDLEKTEDMLRKRFEAIRDTERPALIREIDRKQTWKCRKLCHAGMTSFEDDEGFQHIDEFRPGQVSRYKQPMTKCEQLKYMIEKKGIEWVTENYKHPDHVHGLYKEPGSIE